MGLQLVGFRYFEEKTVIIDSMDIIRTYFSCPSSLQVSLLEHEDAAYAQDSLALFITIWLQVLHFVCANAAIIFLTLMTT
jgi:hypothetical protein